MESGQLNYTWFGNANQLVRVGVSGTEHFDNIDYFWDHAYHHIIPISVSSWILFFIIFYLITTYIKYNIKHSKDKSLTYKQVLKDSTIIIIAIDLSVIVALLAYNHIDWMNPKPAPIAIPLSEALYNFGIIVLIIWWLLTVTIKIILNNRKEKHQ